MTPERWEQVKALFDAALAKPPSDRQAFLESACRDDAELRSEVERILADYDGAGSFLQKPLLEPDSAFAGRELVGQTVSHYRILAKLGEGGMGVVYRAEDIRLDRYVALKFLPEKLSRHPEALERFRREARTASALNHPHICALYDIGPDEQPFLVMELLEGETLQKRLARQRVPLEELLEVASQITDALAAAHAKGIVHRDLKPANIFLTPQSGVKILDFGLAKLVEPLAYVQARPPASEVPTVLVEDQSLTIPGTALGTIAYMSPEQALGAAVDTRTDLFSCGVVLYEMATGKRPFQGGTQAALFDAILHKPPTAPSRLSPELPIELERVIEKALEKDPTLRYQSAGDLAADLKRIRRALSSTATLSSVAPVRRAVFKPAFAAAALLFLAGGCVAWWLWKAKPVAQQQIFTQLTDQRGPELFPSLSPDGKSFVYVSRAFGYWDVYLQRVGGKNATNLTKDSGADNTQPAFSPDGEHIAFRSERQGGGIFVMGATGESVKRLTDFGYNPAWSPDAKEIAFATEGITRPEDRGTPLSLLWSVDVASGAKRMITNGDGVQPHWSPHGYRIAYWTRIKGGQRDIWTVRADLQSTVRDPKPVTQDVYTDWNPVWSADGKWLYFSSDRGGSMNLWRVRINEETGDTRGLPEAFTTPSTDTGHLTISRDGRRMAYVQQSLAANLYKIAFDPLREAPIGALVSVTEGSKQVMSPDLSSDGRWFTFSSRNQEDIFVMKSDGTNVRQLTDDIHKDRVPRWSPDGSQIAFYSNRGGTWEIWTVDPDGSGLRQLSFGKEVHYPVWSPDGKRLAYFVQNLNSFIMDALKPWSNQTPAALPMLPDRDQFFVVNSWSPDGRILAGTRKTPQGIFSGVSVYHLDSHRFEKLTDSGDSPVWLQDSRRLLFYQAAKVWLVDRERKNPHEVFSIDSEDGDFGVSKDSKLIYFTRIIREADIWLVSPK